MKAVLMKSFIIGEAQVLLAVCAVTVKVTDQGLTILITSVDFATQRQKKNS